MLWLKPDEQSPIKTLLVAARRKEWQQKLNELLGTDTPTEVAHLLLEADPLDLQAQLTAETLREHGLPSALAPTAAEISKRPTVIGVQQGRRNADDDHLDEHRKPLLPRIFEAMGLELAKDRGLLDHGRLAFAPVGKSGEQRFDYLDLLGRLQAQLTTEAHSDPASKEGPILLIGQTGSGKTELATSLHHAMLKCTSRTGNFVPINVAAIQPSLLESRLRGYAKGSFTGAQKDHEGWFEQAAEGTLFLDEFQSAPIEVQLQLLDLMRAVSDTVRIARMGEEDKPRTCRVRLILAINEPVERLVAERRLRQDLLFRVRHRINVSPLAKRLNEEIGLLDRLWCLHRWRSNATIELSSLGIPHTTVPGEDPTRPIYSALAPDLPHDARVRLLSHGWPGNLREFERVCFDILWDLDRTGSIASRDWLETVTRAIGSETLQHEVPQLSATTLERLRQAERVLAKHDFKVRPAQPELEGLKLKSPKALKSFLRHQRRHLSLPEWGTNPRAKRLLAE